MNKDNEDKITQEGFNNLKDELENRNTILREEIAGEIDKARQQGDLSENAAYKTALEKNELNESRILELKKILNNVKIIKQVNKKIIGLGNLIKIKDLRSGLSYLYKIVSETEADPIEKKISVDSPLGLALLNKGEGENIEIISPSGKIQYKILSVS